MDSVGEGEGGKFGRMALKHVKYHVWNEKKKCYETKKKKKKKKEIIRKYLT